jgi:hypothetical protein
MAAAKEVPLAQISEHVLRQKILDLFKCIQNFPD